MISYFVVLILGLANLCRAANDFTDGAISTLIDGKSVEVGFSKFPSDFDPNKPTIVYLMGGPVPFSDRHVRPSGLPNSYQILIVDNIGTTRDGKSFPTFSEREIMKNFTNDRQASLIRDVIRSEKLSNYILFGESHGVQLSLRTIDTIQKDTLMPNKPIAAVLDSGMGRQISAQDVAANNLKGRPGPHGKCENISSTEAATNLSSWPSSLNIYLNICHLNDINRHTRDQFFSVIIDLLPQQVDSRMTDRETAQRLKDRIGCPPANKFNDLTWARAMSCGVFEKGVGNNPSCLSQCQADERSTGKNNHCQQSCIKDSNLECQDSPLDAKNYRMGNTKILGIQSLDDCQNSVGSMDYLMDHLKRDPTNPRTADVSYVRVANAGGHVTFRDTPAFSRCREPKMENDLFAKIFNSDVNSARQMLLNCYNGSFLTSELVPSKGQQ